MIWHLIAALFAALGAAGVAQILRVITRRKLPKWIIPFAAGAGLLGYQIYYEYSWFTHKQALLPEASQVVASEQGDMFWRPWTYLFPLTVGFTVVDTDNVSHVQQGAHVISHFRLYRFRKEYVDLIDHQPHVLNCMTRELVPVAGDGGLRVQAMRRVETDDPLYQAVCPRG